MASFVCIPGQDDDDDDNQQPLTVNKVTVTNPHLLLTFCPSSAKYIIIVLTAIRSIIAINKKFEMRFTPSSTLAIAATTALYYTTTSTTSVNAFVVQQQHQRQQLSSPASSKFGIVQQQQPHSVLSISSTTTATTRLNMAETKLSQDELKKQVGYKAVDDYVKSGMVVGLGTGSTAYFAVERVGELLKSGELKDVICIPTSERTKEQALSLDIPLVTLDTHSKLDVAIDGADEVDPDLNLVKGGGGALLREKMVEVMADKFIVIGTFFFSSPVVVFNISDTLCCTLFCWCCCSCWCFLRLWLIGRG